MPTTGDSEMLERPERVETEVDRLAAKLGAVERRLGDRLDVFEKRLGDGIGRVEVKLDQFRGDLQKMTENYAVGFYAISRQLTTFHTDLMTRLMDQDRVIRDHGRQISALEQSRPR